MFVSLPPHRPPPSTIVYVSPPQHPAASASTIRPPVPAVSRTPTRRLPSPCLQLLTSPCSCSMSLVGLDARETTTSMAPVSSRTGDFLLAPPPPSARSPSLVSGVGERENANTVITAVFVFISDCTRRRRPYRATMRSPSPTYAFRMAVCCDADSSSGPV
ncbi:hypothetical protein GALMADRAFT_1083040 [Galerina marginata CBS 339.88]|uniref:Uncharacterized protein n=1 Tax=Galerina marginata (strain CBS 339.88) TaxID=685588 RepID=A0A067S9L7_GALM3|nr:hypothetical protein GALMADRAFT_1083040 [Galerina marginata CBS 339.88]